MQANLKSVVLATIAASLVAFAFGVSAQALPYGAPISIDNAK